MRNLFPFESVEKNSRIILYCATAQGYEFYRQVKSTNYCEIVLWVDRQYQWYQSLNLPVSAPEDIKKSSYDLIVLACETKKTKDSIAEYLINCGVDSKKIIWKEDYSVGYDIVAKYDELRMKNDSETAICINPINLLEERRMDVVIRYMYAKDLAEKRDAKHTEYLYKKLIYAQTNAEEETDKFMLDLFSAYERKEGIDAFINGVYQLLASMQNEGFNRKDFIPIDRKNRMLNGAHRCAVAIALGINVWVKKYDFDGFQWDFSTKWMKDNEFTDEEIQHVLETYHKLIQEKED